MVQQTKEIKRNKEKIRESYSPRRRFEAPTSNNHANHARNTLDIEHEMQLQQREYSPRSISGFASPAASC
jgi:hypothetical protein